MQLDNFMIALIVISIFVTGFGGMYVGLMSRYGISASQESLQTFNKLNSSYAVADSISEDIMGASVQEEASDWDVSKTLRSALKALKVVFLQGLPNGITMIANINILVPIPAFVIVGLQAILVIVVLFALIYLYLRYKNQ